MDSAEIALLVIWVVIFALVNLLGWLGYRNRPDHPRS